MKKAVLIAFASILAFACSKNNDQVGSGFPEIATLYFDIKKSDGTSFEEGDISYKLGIFSSDNGWVFGEDWTILKKNDATQSYFGALYFPVGWEEEDTPEAGSEWVEKRYYVLKYLDTEVIDTIMVRDSTRHLEYRYYDIFLNGEIINSYTQENYDDFVWLVSFTKNEF